MTRRKEETGNRACVESDRTMKKTSINNMGDSKDTAMDLPDHEKESYRREILKRTLRKVRERNADLSKEEAGKLADEAVAAVRADRRR